MDATLREKFLDTARAWLCDGYQLDVRYITAQVGGLERLLAGALGLSPLPLKDGYEFHVNSGRFRAGQFQLRSLEDVTRAVDKACAGRLECPHGTAQFESSAPLSFYSDNPDPNRPGVDLHLRVLVDESATFDQVELLSVDSQLRRCSPPFDGMLDLCAWLGLPNPANHSRHGSIDIRINPPIDLGETATLEANHLVLTFRALEKIDLSAFELGIRVAPGIGLSRFLASSQIKWDAPLGGLVLGRLELKLAEADVVQCMLTLGPHTIRRHVLVDRTQARTLRLAAVMSMDPNLSALAAALRHPGKDRDAPRFEKAVATLLFLYGFIPTPQADSDGPDLLVGTPGGRLALVECTLKLTDFNGKVSKLAARRNRLASDLRTKGHAAEIHAVLVCASPRTDILGIDDLELANQNVTLVTSELLHVALERVQTAPDPDELLQKASATLIEMQRRATP